jgi:NitT/TauT family transport system ATP-binding protein
MGTAPGEAGRTRALPNITIDELAGLLEYLDEAPYNRADIYQVAEELKVELDLLLPLTEGAELLGSATVAQGDITLTPLWETFAEASILARKEIVAMRIRRLPIFQWLLAMLQAAEAHQLGPLRRAFGL